MEEKIQNHLKTVGGFVGNSHFYDYGLPELHMTLSVPQLQFSAVMAWLVWIWTRAPIWKPPSLPCPLFQSQGKAQKTFCPSSGGIQCHVSQLSPFPFSGSRVWPFRSRARQQMPRMSQKSMWTSKRASRPWYGELRSSEWFGLSFWCLSNHPLHPFRSPGCTLRSLPTSSCWSS